jgi:DNA-binding transcriptional MerR regulator
VPEMEQTKELIPIGRFARLSGLTVKALRHYGEIGLLEPAWVDPETGYRWYALEQARTAEAIRRLRRLELSLEEIRPLLAAPDDVLREQLVAHRSRLEGRAVETRRILAELQRLIDGEEALVPDARETRIKFEMTIDEVPEQRLLAVVEQAHSDEMSTVIPRGITEVHGYLKEIGAVPVGPPVCVCPFPDDDGMVETTIGWPVAPDVPGRGRIVLETLSATRALLLTHTGPYTELARSYRLMSEAMERNGLTGTGPPREIYRTDPEKVPDPNDYETVIVWPIGPDGRLEPDDDYFFRRVDA